MKSLDKLLNKEIIPTLTDFLNDQLIFWDAFEQNKKINEPIKNILELGVYRIHGEPNSKLPGQSTKTLMILSNFHPIDKYISLDIDDCRKTIEMCKNWVEKRGCKVENHKFVQCNSINFDIKKEFPNGLDLIFLDTNHDDNYPEKIGFKNSGGAGMTHKEICYYAPHLNKNGRLFIHDTNHFYVEKKYGYNTSGAIEKFIDENPEFDFREHNSNKHGLGEIFRKDSDITKWESCL